MLRPPFGALVYPYDSKLRWWIRGRQAHLVDAVARDPALLEGERGAELQSNMKRLKRWLIAKAVMMAFLSMGAIASAVAFILRRLPGLAAVEDTLSTLAQISSGLAGLFTVGYIITNRTLGQLEIDSIVLFHLQHHKKH